MTMTMLNIELRCHLVSDESTCEGKCGRVWWESLAFELTGSLIPKLSWSEATLQGIHSSCLVQGLCVVPLGRSGEGHRNPENSDPVTSEAGIIEWSFSHLHNQQGSVTLWPDLSSELQILFFQHSWLQLPSHLLEGGVQLSFGNTGLLSTSLSLKNKKQIIGQVLFCLIIAYQAVSQGLAKDMKILINYPVFKSNLDTAMRASLWLKEHAVFAKASTPRELF